jgi:hypothetical protein
MLAVRRLSMAVAEDRARFVFIIMVALVLRQRLAEGRGERAFNLVYLSRCEILIFVE